MIGGVKWRLLAVAAAVIGLVGAAGLGVDVAVAGVDRASASAGVIAGFCELTAFVLGMTGWVAKRRTALTGADSPGATAAGGRAADVNHEASGETEGSAKYEVDARDTRGLQIGDHNIQRNDFRRASSGWESEAGDGR